jgi:uncharacterized protein YdhG (YjbR/CyaY superfamily)
MAPRRERTFTDEERAAMRERAREQRRRRAQGPEEGEAEVLAAIAKLPPSDREIAERMHAVIRAAAPALVPRTWYGMPAYARDGDVVCFVQVPGKFKARYATLGFTDKSRLDDGRMWPTSYALAELTPAVEARVRELVRQAAG